MKRAEVRRWLASGDGPVPRTIRRTLRGVKRAAARLRSGSVTAEMDRIVAEATNTERGSGLSIGPHELSQRRRAAATRSVTTPAGPERVGTGTADREHLG